jgi:NTP pyrophosphatase (non-canonical NTP hydrolase)
MSNKMNELIKNVKEWGVSKGITGPNGKGTLLSQLSKTQEELTETRDAAVRLIASNDRYDREDSKLDLIDGIGDCTVTLILAAEIAGLDFKECLEHAYNEIKGRTGTMIGGQFVKDV